jgi:hypothetical protein
MWLGWIFPDRNALRPVCRTGNVNLVVLLPVCRQRGSNPGQRLGWDRSCRGQVLPDFCSHGLKASELTEGHDVCSADPWVFGLQFPESPSIYGPIAYHSNAEAMDAVANRLDQLAPLL